MSAMPGVKAGNLPRFRQWNRGHRSESEHNAGSDDAGADGTTVVLPAGYVSDLGRVDGCKYIEPMALVLLMVVLAFGLLYVAVVAEERQMQEATKPRKR
jgi:hypothetical protein